MDQAIILFDGVCNFCNSSVNFIIDRDPKNYFTFGALQSIKGQALLQRYDLSQTALDTLILIEGKQIYPRSTAALRIAKRLSGLWPLFYCFVIIPRFLRDPIYDLIAKYRYKIFGKREVCRVPTAEERARFL